MRSVTTLSVLVLVAAQAQAQNGLTEADFLRPFESDTHPAVQALGDDLARAEAARRRAGTLANPRLEYAREHPDATPLQTTWTVAWTPPLDGRLGLAKAAGTAGVDAARQRLAVERLRLRSELRTAYADWTLSLERRDTLATQLEAVKILAERERHRFLSGETSGLDAQRLALAAGEIAAALGLADAEAARQEARARAWRPDLETPLRPTRPALPSPPPEVSVTSRPDLEVIRFEAEQARLESRLAGRFIPFPELQAGWQRLDSGGHPQTGPVFGVAWSIPLFDRSQAARLETTRRYEAAKARLTLGEVRAKAELAGAVASYDTLVRSARESSEVASGVDRLVDGVSAAFSSGEADVTDLLATLQSVRETRLREIELYGAALDAHRNLEAALGRPLSDGGIR